MTCPLRPDVPWLPIRIASLTDPPSLADVLERLGSDLAYAHAALSRLSNPPAGARRILDAMAAQLEALLEMAETE